MSWRVILVSSDAYVSLEQNRLAVAVGNDKGLVPLEDIATIVIESRQATVTTALLDACVEHKISVMVCDAQHMPSGILMPFYQHSRQLEIIRNQMAWTEPFRKRCWQAIVRQKIHNQMLVAEYITDTEHPELQRMMNMVDSGDTLNIEAQASRYYFDRVLPGAMRRSSPTLINAGLNYGYAIVRALTARALAGFGFLPTLGLHHKSILNGFNLADDMMEVLRPVVDYVVLTTPIITESTENELTREMRALIVQVLLRRMIIAGASYELLRTVETMVHTLSTATKQKKHEALRLPIVVTGEIHYDQ